MFTACCCVNAAAETLAVPSSKACCRDHAVPSAACTPHASHTAGDQGELPPEHIQKGNKKKRKKDKKGTSQVKHVLADAGWLLTNLCFKVFSWPRPAHIPWLWSTVGMCPAPWPASLLRVRVHHLKQGAEQLVGKTYCCCSPRTTAHHCGQLQDGFRTAPVARPPQAAAWCATQTLAKCSLYMEKSRAGDGFSFNIMPVSLPVCKDNLKTHPKPGSPGLSTWKSFAKAALLLPKELQN